MEKSNNVWEQERLNPISIGKEKEKSNNVYDKTQIKRNMRVQLIMRLYIWNLLGV